MLKITLIYYLICLVLFSHCHNYLSEDVPIVVRPVLNERLGLITIAVSSQDSAKSLIEITSSYAKYINDSGYFGNVITDGTRSAHHIDIYTSQVNEYEHFWVSSLSTLFMAGTLGILPAIYSKERVLIADFYVNGKFNGRERYRQKHSTLFGLLFFLIWETGIKDGKTIEYNKEKNMINNMLQDYNRYL